MVMFNGIFTIKREIHHINTTMEVHQEVSEMNVPFLPPSLPPYLPPSFPIHPFPSSLPSPSTQPPTLPTFLPMWPSFPPYFHFASPPSFPSIPFSPFFLPLPFPFPLLPYLPLLLCSHPFCLTPFISPFIFSCLFPHPTPLAFPPVPVLSSFPSFCVSTPSLPPRLFCPLHSPLLPFPYFPSSSLLSILSSSAVPPPCLLSFALSILPLVFFLSSYCNFLPFHTNSVIAQLNWYI